MADGVTTDAERWKIAGKMLRERRDAARLSRAKVAKAVGLDASTLQSFENGGRTVHGQWILPSPTAGTLRAVLTAYGVKLDEWNALGIKDAQVELAGKTMNVVVSPGTVTAVAEVGVPTIDVSQPISSGGDLSARVERVEADLVEVRGAVSRLETLLAQVADEVRSLQLPAG